MTLIPEGWNVKTMTLAEKLEYISPVWITPNAQHVPIGNLSVEHIRAILKRMKRGRFGRNPRNMYTMDEWQFLMEAELKKRERPTNGS